MNFVDVHGQCKSMRPDSLLTYALTERSLSVLESKMAPSILNRCVLQVGPSLVDGCPIATPHR